MKVQRSGLTLIELLAALALLALIVSASLPVLQSAAAALHLEEIPAIAVEELGALADRIVAEPEAFGIESLQAIEHVTIDWPPEVLTADETAPSVQVDLLRADGADHGWLRFTADDVATLRWVEIEEAP